MGHIAEHRDDISGLLTTSGTSTAYVVTTNQGLCLSPSTTPQDGQQLSITVNATNGLSPTLQADTCNTYPIQSSAGVAVPAATLGGQFPVADVRGRNLTALDNLGGSAASRLASSSSLKFAGAVRGKSNLLNHLRQNSLTESVHVIGCADVHKSSNL